MAQIDKMNDVKNLLGLALDVTRVGVIVTDPSQQDNPIIYTNKGFTYMTGYTENEVMGENCRFLQGENTNPASVQLIRDAIRTKTPVTVQILNYRKDGKAFWNDLSIDPVEIEGQLYFVGVQKDITETVEQKEQINQNYNEMLQMSTPIVPISDGVSVLPIIGVINEQRYEMMIGQLMQYMSRNELDTFIIDLSGLVTIDSITMERFLRVGDMFSLTGAQVIFSGITPRLATNIHRLGIDLSKHRMTNTVQTAIRSLGAIK